jgi:hypothetical protein
MNLKETIISSFFFHIILFLFMIAVSNYTTGFTGDFQNIVSVDFTMEEKKPSKEAIEPADKPPPAAGLQSMEEASLQEEAADNQPEEPVSVPEPEEKVETAEPAKIENAEKPPAEREGPPSMEAYYQFIMLHKKIFGQKAGARVNELLGEALKVNTRNFYGGTAIVSLRFGPDRMLNEVYVDSESPDLKAFFEEFVWDGIPAPAQFSLGYTGVQIEFTVLQGYMSFRIEAL